MTGICVRNVTHLSSYNILPVNIFKLYMRHNMIKEHKKVILKKCIRTSMEEEEMKKTQIICAGRYW